MSVQNKKLRKGVRGERGRGEGGREKGEGEGLLNWNPVISPLLNKSPESESTPI